MSLLRLLILPILLAAGVSLVLSCDSRRDQVVQPLESGWTAAPRILAGDVTSAQIDLATVVVVTATMGGEIVSTKDVRGARIATLPIPRAGTVVFTLQGWLDTEKTVLLWSGTCSLDPENPSREATLQVGPGLHVGQPTFASSAKTGRDSLVVLLQTSTADARIRYTLDGADPAGASAAIYQDSIVLRTSAKIRAIAARPDFLPSQEWSDSFTVTRDSVIVPPQDSVLVPTATAIAPNPKDSLRLVLLQSATEGSVLRYTLDGSDPVGSDDAVVKSGMDTLRLLPGSSVKIRAIATKDGFETSGEFQQTFVAPARVEPVTLTKKTVGDSVLVVLASSTAGATVKFTTTDADPFSSSASTFQPNDTIRLGKTTTILAVATFPDLFASRVLTETITIEIPPDTVTPPDTVAKPSMEMLAMVPGDSVLRYRISSQTEGANIRYTLDNSDPARSTTTVASPATFSVPAGTQVSLRAIAVKEGMAGSLELKSSIDVPDRVEPVTMVRKTYPDSTLLVLRCATSGASIRYTTNGGDPLDATALRFGPNDTIRLGKNTVVRSVAVLDGFFASQRRMDPIEILPGWSWTFDTDTQDPNGLYSNYYLSAAKNESSTLKLETVGGVLSQTFEIRQDVGTEYSAFVKMLLDWKDQRGTRDLRTYKKIEFLVQADTTMNLIVEMRSPLYDCDSIGFVLQQTLRVTTEPTPHTLFLDRFVRPGWLKEADGCNESLVSVVDATLPGYSDEENNVASAITGFAFSVEPKWGDAGKTVSSPTGTRTITFDNIKILP